MLVFRNARLIDGTGRPPADGCTIVIEGERFSEVSGTAVIPENANVIDLQGRTVIPGLIDAHTHFSGSSGFDRPGFGRRRETYDYAEARESFLDWGVTTVRSCGDIGSEILSYCRSAAEERRITPRVLAVGPWFQAKGGHPGYTVGPMVGLKDEETLRDAAVIIEDDTDVEAEVARVAAMGVFEIKAFLGHINKGNYPVPVPHITQEQLSRVVRQAHALGKRVICHVDDPVEMEAAVRAGADGVEHALAVGAEHTEFSPELLDLLVSRGTAVDPTMISILRWEHQVPGARPVYEKLKDAVRRMYEAGVTLAAGCDSGIPFVPFGESLHDEMKCLTGAGIPPLEVLRMATGGNAAVLGLDGDLGSVAPGKLADLLVLGGDPLEDIENTKDILLVMQNGRILRDRLLRE